MRLVGVTIIKCTSTQGGTVWLNTVQIVTIIRLISGTKIDLSNGKELRVRETPEQIMAGGK